MSVFLDKMKYFFSFFLNKFVHKIKAAFYLKIRKMSTSGNSRLKIYDKLHKLTITGILGISLVSAGLVFYNFYLFKKGNFICLKKS